jgi:hypothetical protein
MTPLLSPRLIPSLLALLSLAGYSGKTCGKVIDYCEALVCLNGGTCLNKRAGADCRCAPGWDGPKCEKNLDECLGGPCKNGGICIDGINSFSCNCTGTGFEGKARLTKPQLLFPCPY